MDRHDKDCHRCTYFALSGLELLLLFIDGECLVSTFVCRLRPEFVGCAAGGKVSEVGLCRGAGGDVGAALARLGRLQTEAQVAGG